MAGTLTGRTAPATATGTSGWVDWAEWVEPVEASLAAVSGTALVDRITDLYGPDRAPHLSHVLIVAEVGAPAADRIAHHKVRAETMARVRAHFPHVAAVAAVGASRYAVLARRHPGLPGSIAALERRLQLEIAGVTQPPAVWCEELPERSTDVDALIRGVRVVPTPSASGHRNELAMPQSVESLAWTEGPPRPALPRRRRGILGGSAALAVGAALLMSGAGAAAAVGARYQPWTPQPEAVVTQVAGARIEHGAAQSAAGLAAGTPESLVGHLLALIEDDRRAGQPGASPDPAPATPLLPVPALGGSAPSPTPPALPDGNPPDHQPDLPGPPPGPQQPELPTPPAPPAPPAPPPAPAPPVYEPPTLQDLLKVLPIPAHEPPPTAPAPPGPPPGV